MLFKINNKRICLFIPGFIILFSFCEKRITKNEIKQNDGDLGFINISYRFEQVEDPVPSYQTAVWLKDEEGHYLKPIYISEWLAYLGHQYDNICPTWNQAAEWQNVYDSLFDAVTSTTVPVGPDSIGFSFEAVGLIAGVVKVNIETHNVEDYNIRYSANRDRNRSGDNSA